MTVQLIIDPNVQPVVHDGIRWYPLGGKWLPSVTSILADTRVDGEALASWKARPENSTAEAIARVEGLRDAGAARGHQLNDEIEQWDLYGVLPPSTWGRSVWPVLDDIQRVHGRELAVVHPELGCASRLDLLAQYMFRQVVIDWKTSRKRKRLEWIGDYIQQVALYVAAVPLCYPDLPAPTGGVVAIALEEHQLRCVCGWSAKLSHESDCPKCGEITDTVSVRGAPAQTFHLDQSDLSTAFDRFAERAAMFHLKHEPPDLPLPTTLTAANAAG